MGYGLTVVQVDEVLRLHRGGLLPSAIEQATGIRSRTVGDVIAGRYQGRELTARERFDEDVRTGWAPACMDAGEFAVWRDRNPLSGIKDAEMVARPCEDCLLGFAADMRAEGRCNGEPGGAPEATDEEEPMDEITATRKVAVAVGVPCAGCAHAPICRIAPALAELARVSVVVPVLDDAIGVELAAAVTCAHFTKGRAATGAGDKPKRSISPEGRAAIAAAAQARRAREKAERDARERIAVEA